MAAQTCSSSDCWTWQTTIMTALTTTRWTFAAVHLQEKGGLAGKDEVLVGNGQESAKRCIVWMAGDTVATGDEVCNQYKWVGCWCLCAHMQICKPVPCMARCSPAHNHHTAVICLDECTQRPATQPAAHVAAETAAFGSTQLVQPFGNCQCMFGA
jgi:hypothetical protein